MTTASPGEGEPQAPPLPHVTVLDEISLSLSGYTTEFLQAAMHGEHERAPGSWLEQALCDYLTAWRGVLR